MSFIGAEDYKKANKMAQKEYDAALAKGVTPYPKILDEILKEEDTAGVEELGIRTIPLDRIVGTKTEGRKNAFSPGFLPLFDFNTEFADKWINLMDSQMEEGIRDPIKVFEYMNFYYVQEGNKRVSVLKYLKAVSIEAQVSRILPKKSNDPEIKLYYEFVEFNRCSGVVDLLLSNPGDYGKLLRKLGKEPGHIWTKEEREEFSILWSRFIYQYGKTTQKSEAKTNGDAFLLYLDVHPFEQLREKNSMELGKDIQKMKKEFDQPTGEEVERLMDPEEEKNSLFQLFMGEQSVKVAFVFDQNPDDSSWLYAHELGMKELRDTYGDQLIVEKYICTNADDIEKVIAAGANVIFVAASLLLSSCLKVAIDHPEVEIFCCAARSSWKSLRTYYVRLHEVKFLIGLIAGAMAGNREIYFEADYPVYSTMANINAFALGVSMTNPRAKVHLVWEGNKEEYKDAVDEENSIVSDKDMITPGTDDKKFGLFIRESGQVSNIATSIIDWGVFYEKIIKQMKQGNLKKNFSKENKAVNYWWGLSSGVIDLICSSSMPVGVRKLVEHFKSAIVNKQFNPFEGVLYDQDGNAHGEQGKALDNEEIVRMDWLNENIVGDIPKHYQLNEKAKRMVELQGVKGEGDWD